MKKILLGILCWTGVISCTRLDLAVNWADTYIASKVDDYFDLTSSQSKSLKASLQKDIRHLRKTEFPKWAEALREFDRTIANNTLTEAQFKTFFRQTLDVSQQLQPAFTETAVNFIVTTTPAQLDRFEKAIREKNIEDEKKIQNREKARKEARKKHLRWIEMWIESLTDSQNQLLNQHLEANPFPAAGLSKNRDFVLNQFRAARKSPEDLKAFVRSYYTDKTRFADPAYQKALEAYQARLEKFSYQFLKSLEPSQREALRSNLQEKAALLEKMAAKD